MSRSSTAPEAEGSEHIWRPRRRSPAGPWRSSTTSCFRGAQAAPTRGEMGFAMSSPRYGSPHRTATGFRSAVPGCKRRCEPSRPTSCYSTIRSGQPRVACRAAHELGAVVIAVHHASPALNAAGVPGPQELYRAALRRWYRRAYLEVDAVMSVVDPGPDACRPSTLPLRLGLDPAFGPWARDEVDEPGDHVLYAGRLSREKGVRELRRPAGATRDLRARLVRGGGVRSIGRNRIVHPVGGADPGFGRDVRGRGRCGSASGDRARTAPQPRPTRGRQARGAAQLGRRLVPGAGRSGGPGSQGR